MIWHVCHAGVEMVLRQNVICYGNGQVGCQSSIPDLVNALTISLNAWVGLGEALYPPYRHRNTLFPSKWRPALHPLQLRITSSIVVSVY